MTPKIAFLAANSERHAPLELSKEYRAIDREMRFRIRLGQIQLQSLCGARLEDLREALDGAPTVLHLGGDQAFQTDDGSSRTIEPEALAREVKAAKARRQCGMPALQLAVLNYCNSNVHAQALCKHVPCVVASTGKIFDRDAIIFSREFYHALANYKSVAEAFEHSCEKLTESWRHSRRDVVSLDRANVSDTPFKLYGNAARNIRIMQSADCTEPLAKRRSGRLYRSTPSWISAIAIVVFVARNYQNNTNDTDKLDPRLASAPPGVTTAAVDAPVHNDRIDHLDNATQGSQFDHPTQSVGKAPRPEPSVRQGPGPTDATAVQRAASKSTNASTRLSEQMRAPTLRVITRNEERSSTSMTPIVPTTAPGDGEVTKPAPSLEQMLEEVPKRRANGGLRK